MKIKITTKILNREVELITVQETADKLGVTRQAVLKMINKGYIRAFYRTDIGKKVYFIPEIDIKTIK